MALSDLFMAEPEASLATPFPAEGWESHLRDIDPASVGIVRPDLLAEVSVRDVVDQVLERREESRRAREPLEWDWRYFEDMYHFRWRDDSKESWQSDINVPEVYNRVRQTLSMLRSALVEPVRFFTLIKKRQIWSDDAILRFRADWLDLSLEQSRYIEAAFATLEEALLLGTSWLKITLEDEIRQGPRVETKPLYPPEMAMQLAAMGMQTSAPQIVASPERRRKIMCRHVFARDAYPDPTAGSSGDPQWFYEEAYVARHIVEERKAAGVYDSLEDLGEPERKKEDSLGLPWQRRDFRETVLKQDLIGDYTGNIYTRKGDLVAKNVIATIGNNRALLRIRYNPVFSGKSRYVRCTPIPCEGRVWGRSIVEAAAEFQEEMSDLINLMLDDARYSIIPMFSLNVNKLEEPYDTGSASPGKMWRTYGPDAVTKMQLPSQINNVWPLLQQLERLGDKSSPVTEWSSGTPTARGRASATEATQKSSAAMSFIDDLAGEIERTFIEPGLELVDDYNMQFGDDMSDPRLEELMQEWGGPEAMRDEVYRYSTLSAPFKIQVRGISMLAQREQLVPRIMQTITLMQQLGFMPWDMVGPVYTIIAAQGFSPDQFGLPPSPEDYRMVMQQQAAMGGPMGGGGGVQTGGAPEPSTAPTGPPSPDSTMKMVQANSPPLPG